MISPAVVGAVLVRPWLWVTAVVQMGRLARRGWWRRPPFLPLPAPDYMEFRLVTQYGGEAVRSGRRASAADVVDYLQWCRDWNRSAGRSR
ncbi:MAG: hypothetical protein EBT79_09965 [Actinobacteria bacterium]|nr:hypothetical protein [Actinomycetota bacterium]